ncbi:MAG TPA: hypothetical protein VGN63_09240 [Flavisolibacter sp.]|jgi:hypothetical protein|nr:hypothetical protein [Flavisolibacter sp.]
MSFFQTISEDQFNADADFIVKESKKMRLIIGLFLLCFAVLMIQDYIWMAIVAAIPAIASLIASTRNQVIMKINKSGFYYYGKLLTDWNNFVSAEFMDEMPVLISGSAGLSDKFSLYIKYYKNDEPGCFGRKIPLTNTQDKSEEEIIAAVRFYYRNSAIVQ